MCVFVRVCVRVCAERRGKPCTHSHSLSHTHSLSVQDVTEEKDQLLSRVMGGEQQLSKIDATCKRLFKENKEYQVALEQLTSRYQDVLQQLNRFQDRYVKHVDLFLCLYVCVCVCVCDSVSLSPSVSLSVRVCARMYAEHCLPVCSCWFQAMGKRF